MNRKSIILTAALVLLQLCSSLWALPTTAYEAEMAVAGWLKVDPQPLGMALGQEVMRVETFTDNYGEPIYYIVYLKPSGFVIVSADDLIEPIIGFADDGTYDHSPENPLGALVTNDLNGRMAAVHRTFRLQAIVADAPFSDTQKKWSFFISLAETSEGGFSLMGLSSIPDVWVAPLVQSKWGQRQACGEKCYNYYTPDNYPCGCVATAMAQLMRYYQHPTTGIGIHDFPIRVEDVEQTASTRGGNGNGGAYKWGQMVLQPDCSTTLAQQQAIGALCYDAGLSVNMNYSADGSSSLLYKASDALLNTFQYGNVINGLNYDDSTETFRDLGSELKGMVNPNLDAGIPVILGIRKEGSDGGHAVLADGYGYGYDYNSSTLYHHLNMGWDGSDDAWYNLPAIDTDPPYNVVDECIYNIFTTGSGEIISGRVTDAFGSPISGATVTATGQGNNTHTDKTDSKGIYALAKVDSQLTYNLSVTKSEYSFPSQDVRTGRSESGDPVSGNRWGVNFRAGIPPSGPVEDFETNNFRKFPWEHEEDSHWTTTSLEKHSGNHSAQADMIDDYGRTTLRVRLDCISGNISFYRKVSSEELSDYLTFYIDGVEKDTWSGDEDWAEVSFHVKAGTRIFEWTYSKDYSIAEGEDTAWIDDIAFPVGVEEPPPPPPPPPTPVPPPISNLVGWWKFDEGQGSTAYDSAGNNHGTIYEARWTIGHVDGALSFDGNDDYVALPDNNPIWLPKHDFSLSIWVYFARDHFNHSLSGNEIILDLNYGASSVSTNQLGCIIHRLRVSGKLFFQMTTETNPNVEDLYSNEVLVKDTWNHIVAVRDGSTQAIYINGRLDAKRTCSTGPICFEGGYDDDRVNIGRYTADINYPPAGHFKGKIDDFMIFDISLSAAEIQYLFQKTFEQKWGFGRRYYKTQRRCLELHGPFWVSL